ncbi:MAG: hybrid sensor histidine kinase/response regulator [Sphaerospermopsis sp. SIO1G1]|nr:hybrid sensor histidine kinase/response regulator [Sphaerospermopsis sp. SIO1G1]
MSIINNNQNNRILAVDDVQDNLIIVEMLLESEGYEIESVSDGETALQRVLESPPHLILLDIMMPGMDGYEVTRRIRNNPEIKFIPILLITAFDESSVVEGLDAGADDFIRKPFDTDELLARVRSLLRLKHSMDEQHKLAEQREDFVSRLTHDLRTPLVAADRMLALFQQEAFGSIPAEMKEAIEIMIRSNQNLMVMVNNLLEVYRFEAGKKTFTLSKCDIKKTVTEVIDELNPIAIHKNLTLTLNTKELKSSENDQVIVMGDKLELRRVFNNIIANAIKFTDTGNVDIKIFKNTNIIISVTDTGCGIAPDDQETIFERFSQGRNNKHSRSGSGLGLHLSQIILAAHRGTIELSSELGKGSIFTIKLPTVNSD